MQTYRWFESKTAGKSTETFFGWLSITKYRLPNYY